MTDTKNRISIEDSKKVLIFYLKILLKFKWHSFFLIFSGFLLRSISILIFVLLLKIFMSIIDPSSSLEIINTLLFNNVGKTINENTMLLGLLGGLTCLIIVQLIIGKINLALAIAARTRLLNFCLNTPLPLNDHKETHLHIAIDHIPPGYDAVVKSFEILFFYVVLLICIFYMSPLMGFAVLISVPLVLILLILKGRKEVFVTQEFREARKNFQPDKDSNNLSELISLSNQSFSFPLKDMINSQLTSSMAIVIIMAAFMLLYENFEYRGIAAMLLVFSIRYSLIYAAELSRFLNRLFKQRVIIEKIHHNPFITNNDQ